jgi:hypothetical protein
MAQLTAVEWLIEELGEYFPHEIGGIHLMVNKAKAMEKEQILKAYDKGYCMGDFELTNEDIEKYYKETYES